MQLELRGFGLSSYVALSKTIVYEANLLSKEYHDRTLAMVECGLVSPDLPCSKVIGALG